ncbi:hypothetical protein N9A45_00435 [bacterium]|nr:hypothetical protein [bacterium]
MNIQPDDDTATLRRELLASQSFKKNPVSWSVFYASSISSIIMFAVLCALSAWSVSIGTELREVLQEVNEIVPEVSRSLQLLKKLCSHANWTKNYGECTL